MGIWIELGVFALVFVFAAHQWHDLKKRSKNANCINLKRSSHDGQ
jgi:hypothetical protein